MKIKEKIIRQAIKETEIEIKKINDILNTNPISDIIKLRRKTFEIAQKMDAGSKEVLEYLNGHSKKEKTLFRLAKKQQDSLALIDRKVKFSIELGDLKSELYLIMNR